MKSIKKFFFANWYRSILTVITLLLGLYALAGFVIVPWLARPRAVEAIHELTNRETRLDKIKLNPFTLSATIEGFEITDLDGEPLISLTSGHANVQLLSLVFKDEFHIKVLSMVDPFFRAEVNKDGNINFADIVEKFSSKPKPEEDASQTPPSKHLKVDQLVVRNGSVSISDLSRSAPFHTSIYPINFEINEFHTSGESDAPYGFSATTESGESVKWEGYVALAPVRSAGAFEVTDVSLPKYDPFADIFLRTDIIDGTIGVAGKYNYLSGPDSKAMLENAEITIRNLKVVEEADQSPILSLGQGTITGIVLDAIKSELTVESVTMDENQVHLTRMEDGQIDVLNLIKVEQIQKPEKQDADVEQETTPVEFKYLLKSLSINNSSIEILDETIATPTLLAVDQIELGLENFQSKPGSEAGISLSTNIRSGGSVKIVGNFSLQPIRATLDLDVSDFALSAGNGYLAEFLDLQLEDGEINATGQAIVDLSNDLPTGGFTGNVRVIGLKAIDLVEGEELATLSLFNMEEIKVELDPMSVVIGNISIVDPRANIVINQDGSNNLMRVLRVPTEQPEESSTPEDDQDQEDEVAVSDDTESTESPLPFPVTIGSITLENAGAVMTDNSIAPSVQLGLETLSGTIEGLSSEEQARADLKFSGKLVGGTQLYVKGKINPLSSNTYSDMEVSFQGFNLTAVSPYSGKFAGYALNKGKLSFEMNYKVSHAELTGENVVHIDQLTLGDKVESEDAPNLPLPMAIALLKDKDGMIEIDIPVSGNLNDPEFSLGRVISRTVLNVITNVITSPFSILGNLASGGEEVDLSRVAFSPGFRELETDSIEKLDLMAEALKERPNLGLDIIGSAGSPDEIEAIRLGKLETNLKTLSWQELKDSGSPVTTVEDINLSVVERNQLIQQSFLYLFPEEESAPLEVPPAPAPAPEEEVAVASSDNNDGVLKTIWKKFTGTSSDRETAADAPDDTQSVAEIPIEETDPSNDMEPVEKLTVLEMEERMLTTIVVDDNDLLELASERAEAVRNYLEVTGGISTDRLFINQPEDASMINAETGNPEVIFKLE